MKKGTFAVMFVTLGLFAWAGLAEGDPEFGKSPGVILAGCASSIIWWATALVVTLKRKDKILLWSIGLSLIGLIFFLASTLAGTNSFGAFWGASLAIALFGCLTIILLLIRLAYLTLNSKQVGVSKNKAAPHKTNPLSQKIK